jgi:hypothetical protein
MLSDTTEPVWSRGRRNPASMLLSAIRGDEHLANAYRRPGAALGRTRWRRRHPPNHDGQVAPSAAGASEPRPGNPALAASSMKER